MTPVKYIKIHADVLYRDDLTDKQKILLGLIRGLKGKPLKITNANLAKLLCVLPDTVTAILRPLEDKKLIRIECKQSRYRRIYSASESGVDKPPTEDSDRATPDSDRATPDENPDITTTNHKVTTTKQKKPPAGAAHQMEVYEYWNLRTGDPWWRHRKLTPDLKQAIKAALKDYPVEDICRAIDNYQAVLQRPEYFWSKKWNLGEFLMRRQGTGKRATDPRQWWRFLDNNFDTEQYKVKSYNGQDGAEYPTQPAIETAFEKQLKADKQRKLEEAAANAG